MAQNCAKLCVLSIAPIAEIRGHINQLQYFIHVIYIYIYIYIGFMTVKYEKIHQDSQVRSSYQKN